MPKKRSQAIKVKVRLLQIRDSTETESKYSYCNRNIYGPVYHETISLTCKITDKQRATGTIHVFLMYMYMHVFT